MCEGSRHNPRVPHVIPVVVKRHEEGGACNDTERGTKGGDGVRRVTSQDDAKRALGSV